MLFNWAIAAFVHSYVDCLQMLWGKTYVQRRLPTLKSAKHFKNGFVEQLTDEEVLQNVQEKRLTKNKDTSHNLEIW